MNGKKNIFQNFGSFSWTSGMKNEKKKMECLPQPAVVASQMSMRYPHLSLCDLVRWPRSHHDRCHFYSPIITLSNSRDNVNMYFFFSASLCLPKKKIATIQKIPFVFSETREKMQSGKRNKWRTFYDMPKKSFCRISFRLTVRWLPLSFVHSRLHTNKENGTQKINI